jgi:hypothetical protein
MFEISGINVNSINEIKTLSKLFVYPNPTDNYLTIVSPENLSDIEIIDIYGRIVLRNTNINITSLKIDVRSLSNGYYLIKSVCKNGECITNKFVKK